MLMLRRTTGSRTRMSLMRDTTATATLEFALVVPIMLFLMLVLAQTTLVMTGNLFVHYSAFAATRSAIVIIPSVTDEEPANYIIPERGRRKFDAIHAAAAIALIPVSGRSSESGAPADAIVDGLVEHYIAYDRQTPRWVQVLIADRVRYAVANTDVQVLRTIVSNSHDVQLRDKIEDDRPFGPREAVSVRVEHSFRLSIPVVWPIYSDEDVDGPYSTVRAHYTLTNEGVENALPPRPDVPRIDPRNL
jgi:hypothetical protein